jgi:GNAT superfamily N-acetyltransferase
MAPLLVLALTLAALGCARLTGAGRPLLLGITLGGVALIAATQALPGAEPWVFAVRLGWVALIAAPVLGYALLIRALRRRAGAGATARPLGLVRVARDAGLVANSHAALAAEGEGETISLGWRAEGGAMAGHLRLRRIGATAEVELLYVDPAHRGKGIGGRLIAAAEGEARALGLRRLGHRATVPPEPRLFLAAGFEPALTRDLGAGARLLWLEKAIP